MEKGFTLIELLIVIAIIGILLALSVFGAQSAFKQARDTQRKSDLSQYKTALEAFASKNNGLYISTGGESWPTTTNEVCLALFESTPQCPTDPAGGTYYYASDGDGTGPNATKFVLYSILEDPSGAADNWAVCSDGRSGTAGSTTVVPDCPVGSSAATGTPPPGGGGFTCTYYEDLDGTCAFSMNTVTVSVSDCQTECIDAHPGCSPDWAPSCN